MNARLYTQRQPIGSTMKLNAITLATVIGLAFASPVFAQSAMTWTYEYNAEGALTQSVDGNANATNVTRDKLNRPVTMLQPAPDGTPTRPTVGLVHNGQDRTIQVTDPRMNATYYSLDGLGRLKVLTSPDTGVSTMTLDTVGRPSVVTDARGKTTTYGYDTLSRPSTIAYSSGTGTVLTYDGGGAGGGLSGVDKLSGFTDESGSTSYTFDALGRIDSKTQVVTTSAGTKTFTVLYGWGFTGAANDKLASITYPSGSRVNYTYATNGKLNAITLTPINATGTGLSGTTSNIVTAITYKWGPQVSGWTWSDGVLQSKTFDSFGRMSSYRLGNPAGTGAAAGLTRTVGYDNAARITSFTHTNSSGAQSAFDQSFGYDGLDRLVSSSVAAISYGYAYDLNGNRTTRIIGGANYVNTIDTASNRLLVQEVPGPQTVNHSYTASGSMTTDLGATYAYSDRGRLQTATVSAGDVEYRYNALEQRVVKIGPVAVVPGGAAYFVHNEAGQLLGEYDVNGAPVFETVYMGSTPVAVLTRTGTAGGGNLAVQLYDVYADHLDTPRVIVRSNDHGIVWRWDQSEAFGSTVPNTNPNGYGAFSFNQRFPGQVFDAEVGNFYNWHRDYKPGIGRYAQSDPIGLAGGLNTYSYVNGTPISGIDPSGLVDINLFSAREATRQFASSWNPQGVFSVAGHGNSSAMQDIDNNLISAYYLSIRIKNHPNYIGQTVMLGSCKTGMSDKLGDHSFAQKLADLLGTPVIATTETAWFNSTGLMGASDSGPPKSNFGPWKTFSPRAK